MLDRKTKKTFAFLDKLKSIKHLDIILTVLFIAILLLIYFSTSASTNNSKNNNSSATVVHSSTEFEEYISGLTNQLEEVISNINGAGQAKVLLYFKEGIKTEIAYKIEEKTTSDGTVVQTQSPILITKQGIEEPIILQKIMPKPSSVVVVASGAKDTNVKLNILRLVEATLKLDASSIEIFAGN